MSLVASVLPAPLSPETMTHSCGSVPRSAASAIANRCGGSVSSARAAWYGRDASAEKRPFCHANGLSDTRIELPAAA